MLEAQNISFAYSLKANRIINGVSLEINPGEIVWLRGKSGIGKTTLCQLLSGYLLPQSGYVFVDGQPLPKTGISPVQYVGQHPELALDPRMRMKDSLKEANGNSYEFPEHLVKHLGIKEKWMARFPHELSGGEMQRFCIARALLANPRYLIADEVTTMLDALTQARIWHVLKEEAEKRNLGLLITTHSDALGKSLATRCIDI